jgi:quercetin dioxygenase-like cupin family protein
MSGSGLPGVPADGGPLRCREPATGTVQIDNEHVRVMRWDFGPGAETGWHRHGFLYVVVPVTDGTLLLELPGGKTMTAELKAGVSYTRDAGVEHNVINAGSQPLSFVETELKSLPG